MFGRHRLFWSSNVGDPWEQVSKVGGWLQAHSELWRRHGGSDHLFWCALQRTGFTSQTSSPPQHWCWLHQQCKGPSC